MAFIFNDKDKAALARLVNLAEEHTPLVFNGQKADILEAIAVLINARLISWDSASGQWKASSF